MNTLKSIAGQECQRQMKCVHNKLTAAEVIEDVYARLFNIFCITLKG